MSLGFRLSFLSSLLLHCLVLSAQIMPKLDMPESKPVRQAPTGASQPAASYIAPVDVTWQGGQSAKIIIGNTVKAFDAGQTQTLSLDVRDTSSIQVIVAESVYLSKDLLRIARGQGYLSLLLKDNEVGFIYKSEKEILEEQMASDKASIHKKVEDKPAEVNQANEKAKPDKEPSDQAVLIQPSEKTAPPVPVPDERKYESYWAAMVRVPGGSFDMGCTKEQGDECYLSEKPYHRVTVNNFYISKHDVTQEQWASVMGGHPSAHHDCSKCPVENVSWDDAQDFIKKLNEATGKKYRLPTEAEWEYAARGGAGSQNYKYAGGDNLDIIAWYDGNSEGTTHPVGQKAPNELGLYDMTGNVWQWCSDWYDADYYLSKPSDNPRGPATGTERAVRGGSWLIDDKHCRISFRSKLLPSGRLGYYGFRLASDD